MQLFFLRLFIFIGSLFISTLNSFGQTEHDDIIAQHYGVGEEVKHDPKGAVVVIIFIFFAILFLSYIGFKKRILLSRKVNKARNVIFHANRNDPFWNEKRMKQLGMETFPLFFKHYSEGSLSELSGKLSNPLIEKLQNPKRKKLKIHPDCNFTKLQLIHQKIVFAHDDEDDEKDCFKFYLEAKYDLNNKENPISENESMVISSKTIKFFFIFSRVNDHWVLTELEEEITKLDIEKL